MLRLIVLCAFIAFAKGQTTAVSQCINQNAPLPINTYIKDCITPPCLLPQEQYLVVDIVFRAPRLLRTMRTLAVASVNLGIVIDVPYDLGPNAITCNFLQNTYCPLLPEEVVQYSLNMYIESFFPENTQATVEFRIVDEANVPIWCIRVPIAIVGPISKTSVNGTVTV